MSDSPARPPVGHKRYKSISRKSGDNPFRGQGVTEYTQTVDIDEKMSREQVEKWAREAAEKDGYQFLRLEVIA